MKWITKLSHFEHRQFLTLFGIVFTLVLARIFSADFKNREFPVRILVPFNASETPYYHLVYAGISYAILLVDYSLFGVDVMVIVLMRYITVQLDILIANCRHCHNSSIRSVINLPLNKNPKTFERIKNAPDDDNNNESNQIKNFVMFEMQENSVFDKNNFDWRFKHCVIHHQKVIDILNVTNDCFSFCVVVQILTSTILICLNGFQIILVSGTLSKKVFLSMGI